MIDCLPWQARTKIADWGSAIDIDQAAEVAALEQAVPSWQVELEAVQNHDLSYPSYYTQPFHAYDSGNLSWEAAFQVPSLTATLSKSHGVGLNRLIIGVHHVSGVPKLSSCTQCLSKDSMALD